ncbi:MAG: hypothetical protein GVY04_04790 [Cyanobacteria bacterium]|nr:hypothetical protein [Cyanobacteria bacterium GSL.Bin1]
MFPGCRFLYFHPRPDKSTQLLRDRAPLNLRRFLARSSSLNAVSSTSLPDLTSQLNCCAIELRSLPKAIALSFGKLMNLRIVLG